ncbi:MAG TPA: DUF4446 family protein [Candidatus Paceibacterota bacterium]|nr:DUF4446 family protein [Candidatus Pacearchaeota archaeon]HRZ51028.1 DUF4446 family protein [Candidatus Paceibacterota bacterium]HSA36813.1 DUF4446 family protein [Candidatus Paceibacterota bacterium]
MSLFSKNKRKEPQNIDEVLAQFEQLKERFEKLSQEMEAAKAASAANLKKIAVIRFNPFSELGSNQSFSAAILDEANNGLVITSLFTRNENRVYGKPIKDGTSTFKLTDEEKEAIKKAQEAR